MGAPVTKPTTVHYVIKKTKDVIPHTANKMTKKEQKVENLADGASHDDIVPMINPK